MTPFLRATRRYSCSEVRGIRSGIPCFGCVWCLPTLPGAFTVLAMLTCMTMRSTQADTAVQRLAVVMCMIDHARSDCGNSGLCKEVCTDCFLDHECVRDHASLMPFSEFSVLVLQQPLLSLQRCSTPSAVASMLGLNSRCSARAVTSYKSCNYEAFAAFAVCLVMSCCRVSLQLWTW